MSRLDQRLFQEYNQFFEKAERERRWNVYTDIPWTQVNREATEDLALCAETFCSVEMYLPDYVAGTSARHGSRPTGGTRSPSTLSRSCGTCSSRASAPRSR
jgi:hypothetical protein